MSVRNRSARRWRRTTRSASGCRPPVSRMRAVDGDEALALHAPDHLRHGGPGHLEALGDPGLDDVHVVLLELEDGLAVLLERRVELGRPVLRTWFAVYARVDRYLEARDLRSEAPRTALLVLAAATLTLGLAACGDDEPLTRAPTVLGPRAAP